MALLEVQDSIGADRKSNYRATVRQWKENDGDLNIKKKYMLGFQLNNHLPPAMPTQKKNDLSKTFSVRKKGYKSHNLTLQNFSGHVENPCNSKERDRSPGFQM